MDDIEIEDELLMLDYLMPQRKERVVKDRTDFTDWDCNEFKKRFRLEKETVHFLLSLVKDKIKTFTERNQSISPLTQLLMTLRFYASGSFYITIGDFGGMHNSTVCKIVHKVSDAIASLRANFIYLPRNREEIMSTQEKFYTIARFPRVISAIDGTHIKIISPGGDTAEDFRNRKGFFSLNVQAMCNSDLRFQDIVVRWPGSTHDSMIFSNSAVKYKFDSNNFGNSIILGDSGYFLNNYLITPLSDPRTQAERLFNESHIRTRNVIERCFGVWKRRFPVLSIGMRCRLPLTQDIVVSTAILHNLARERNESEPPLDLDIDIPTQPVFAPVFTEDAGQQRSRTRDSVLQYFENILSSH